MMWGVLELSTVCLAGFFNSVISNDDKFKYSLR